jgi:hypothetical protein
MVHAHADILTRSGHTAKVKCDACRKEVTLAKQTQYAPSNKNVSAKKDRVRRSERLEKKRREHMISFRVSRMRGNLHRALHCLLKCALLTPESHVHDRENTGDYLEGMPRERTEVLAEIAELCDDISKRERRFDRRTSYRERAARYAGMTMRLAKKTGMHKEYCSAGQLLVDVLVSMERRNEARTVWNELNEYVKRHGMNLTLQSKPPPPLPVKRAMAQAKTAIG